MVKNTPKPCGGLAPGRVPLSLARCLCAGGRERNPLDETMQRPSFGRHGQGENHASQHEQEMGLQTCYR